TMTTALWQAGIEWAITFISEVTSEEHDEDGNVVRIKYGVERIPDKMLLKEMQDYRPKLNVDRLVSFILLMGLIKVQIAAGLINKKK
ncbi:hypothetical protein, partial [Streptococcus pneumoniae]|uniref:hypothetical protein n=1 Tax=Streptococcus pneumoniae TaxID=1313 RepID=UPI0018B07A72